VFSGTKERETLSKGDAIVRKLNGRGKVYIGEIASIGESCEGFEMAVKKGDGVRKGSSRWDKKTEGQSGKMKKPARNARVVTAVVTIEKRGGKRSASPSTEVEIKERGKARKNKGQRKGKREDWLNLVRPMG